MKTTALNVSLLRTLSKPWQDYGQRLPGLGNVSARPFPSPFTGMLDGQSYREPTESEHGRTA